MPADDRSVFNPQYFPECYHPQEWSKPASGERTFYKITSSALRAREGTRPFQKDGALLGDVVIKYSKIWVIGTDTAQCVSSFVRAVGDAALLKSQSLEVFVIGDCCATTGGSITEYEQSKIDKDGAKPRGDRENHAYSAELLQEAALQHLTGFAEVVTATQAINMIKK